MLKKFKPIVGFISHARSLIYVVVVLYGTVLWDDVMVKYSQF